MYALDDNVFAVTHMSYSVSVGSSLLESKQSVTWTIQLVFVKVFEQQVLVCFFTTTSFTIFTNSYHSFPSPFLSISPPLPLGCIADSSHLPAEDGPSLEDDVTGCRAEACSANDH